MGKHISIRSNLIGIGVLMAVIIVFLTALVLILTLFKASAIKSVETISFGQNTLYIYHIDGNMYVCTQNISGETCLVGHNTLICQDTTCLQIYNILNIT